VHADLLFNAGRASGGLRPDAGQQSLSELIPLAARQDWAAWDELVKRFGRLILHVARAIGLRDSDAADAAQFTWLRLVEHIHEIRQPEHLAGWLAVTARRESVRIAISGKRYVARSDPDLDLDYGMRYSLAVTDAYPVEGDYSPAVEAALARLPARYEKLIRLLMSDDCPSYAEVAKRMGMPIGSIGPLRMRALHMLRNSLEFPSADVRQPVTAHAQAA
jgi:RNA polymerase sigma factor (sigma-70 family)